MNSRKEKSMKKIINYLLGLLGYRIDKIRIETPPNQTMKSVVQKLAERHQINTIIDVGASNGMWTKMALDYFPKSNYLLVEAQPVHLDALTEFVSTHLNVEFVLAAAGDKQGQIYFNAGDPFGGQASYAPYENYNIAVPVTTIDCEVNSLGLSGPYLLKLDTHGFEIPIFEGASATLEKTEIIVVECYNFKISPECLLFYEMCEYLNGKGFRCIDLADPMWRPYDNAFWQMDLIFIKKDNPQFSYSNYQ
jgi:FkbM family methyltransferase